MLLDPTTELLPQGLDITDSPTFVGLTLSGLTEGSMLFAGPGGVISEDNANAFYDDAGNFLRLNELRLNDNKYIKLGDSQDVLISYDSANTRALIDLTGVANTDFGIVSSSDADIFNIIDNGSDSQIGIGTTPDAFHKLNILNIGVKKGLKVQAISREQNQVLVAATFVAEDNDDNNISARNGLFGAQFIVTWHGVPASARNSCEDLESLNNGIYVSNTTPNAICDGALALGNFLDITANNDENCTITEYYSFYSAAMDRASAGNCTITDFYHAKLFNPDDSNSKLLITNLYGLYIDELITGSSINREIFLAGAGGVYYRDGDIRTTSLSDGYLDLIADTGVRIGDGASLTDYSEFEPDGTLAFKGAATVWDDYVTPLGPNNWNGVSNNPSLTKLFDDGSSSQGVYGFVFSDGDEAIITIQMPHRWKEGTIIQPHIHFMCTSDVSPADNFGIEFEYTWADTTEDFPVNSTLETNDISTGVDTDNMHQIANISASGINGSGHTISSVLICRIKRVAAGSDNYAGGIAILDFDVHYEIDTVGSRQILTK